MLHLRIATSAILLSICFGLIYLDYQYPSGAAFLLPLLLFFSVGTAIDVANLWKAAEYEINTSVAKLSVAVVVSLSCLPLLWSLSGSDYPADCPIGRLGWIAVATTIALGLGIGAEMLKYAEGTTGAVQRIQANAFVVLYVGVPMAMLVAIRDLGSSHWGLAALISMIAATKSADAGAYFTGRALGRHKLIPRLSPGKTIEGAVGGILTSIGVSFAMFHWTLPKLTGQSADYPIWGPILFGCICAIFGMFGDLAESLMKRDTGAKDSGNLLPGLGGVWDVTDSLIGTALPAYLCLLAGAAGEIAMG